ncbi:hypothetical protein [Tenacibaculum salmonis]|uniref:hypothetical protein n=1 Tax=Tenacibaculum sp. P3-BQ1 TaxID=3232310 RepID=UPI0034DDE7FE
MNSLNIDNKSVKEDYGKIKKVFASIKKAVSKEFLWLIFVTFTSIPLSLIISYIISVDAHIIDAKISKEIEAVSEIITKEHPVFRVVYGICFVGMYFTRTVVAAIKTQLNDKK